MAPGGFRDCDRRGFRVHWRGQDGRRRGSLYGRPARAGL